jgi:uncharacterized membrane protein
MMSRNRQQDRIEARNYYQINRKTEKGVRSILDHLTARNDTLVDIQRMLEEIRKQTGNDKDSP